MSQLEIKRLGSYLIDAGLVSPAQIDVALNDQEFMDNMRLGDILVTRGWIKQQTLDYLIEKIVDPEQQRARQSVLQAAMVTRSDPRMTRSGPETVRQSISQPHHPQQTVAQARSLDGSRTIAITQPKPNYHMPPTDSFQINDRKPLGSIPSDDDDMNWVG